MAGSDVIVTVTRMEPPPVPWAIPCSEDLLEVETIVPIGASFTPGQTYRVQVNGRETTAFTLPGPDFPDSSIDLSPIDGVKLVTLETAPPQYELLVMSGLPKGSGCSRFNGYEIRRTDRTMIDIDVTHDEVADPYIICSDDYPILETSMHLGSDFEPGVEYTVRVNSHTVQTFLARYRWRAV